MRGKSHKLYEEALGQLAEEIDRHCRRAAKVRTIKVDYESALRKALTDVFPTASVSGCQVHFMAAVNRQWLAKRPSTLTKRQVNRFACVCSCANFVETAGGKSAGIRNAIEGNILSSGMENRGMRSEITRRARHDAYGETPKFHTLLRVDMAQP